MIEESHTSDTMHTLIHPILPIYTHVHTCYTIHMTRKKGFVLYLSAVEEDAIERAQIITRSASKAEFIRRCVYIEVSRVLREADEPNLLKPNGYKAKVGRPNQIKHAELRRRVANGEITLDE